MISSFSNNVTLGETVTFLYEAVSFIYFTVSELKKVIFSTKSDVDPQDISVMCVSLHKILLKFILKIVRNYSTNSRKKF